MLSSNIDYRIHARHARIHAMIYIYIYIGHMLTSNIDYGDLLASQLAG